MGDEERYELALRRLMGTRCENFTRPLGECLRSGRQRNARYGADQACTSCIAWEALYPWALTPDTASATDTRPTEGNADG